jgi:hypothetical protein
MRHVVVNNETNEIVSSYYGECMANAILPPYKSKRIKEFVDGKPVVEEIDKPHYLAAFSDSSQYSHVLVPHEFDKVNIEDFIMSGEVLTVRAEYIERLEKEKWDGIRKERNALLASTDWTMLRDIPHSPAWENYRQLLRDLTTLFANADDVVFPSPP